jgi:hypothetical protein
VGYFDNRDFNPGKYKAQLPYEAFKRITRADGFWAAKQIAAFRDEDIRAMMAPGKLSSKEDADFIAQTLIERRDMIVQYWFSQATPLDDFQIQSGKLVFKNLAEPYGIKNSEAGAYRASLLNEKGKKIQDLAVDASGIAIDAGWFQSGSQARIEIQGAEKAAPVRVTFSANEVLEIRHLD